MSQTLLSENQLEKDSVDRVLYVLYLCWAVSIPWSLFLMQVFLGIILVYTIARSLLYKKQLFYIDIFLISVLLYIGYRILSALTSPEILKSLVSIADNEWVLASVLILAGNKISLQNRQKIFAVLILSAVMAGVYGIFQGFTGIYFHLSREHGPLGNYFRAMGGYGFYLSFAGNQMMIFFLTLAMLVNTRRRDTLKKVLYIFALLILLGSIFFTFARSTWLALIVFFVILGSLVNRKWFLRITVPLFAVSLVLFFLVPDLQSRFLSIFDSSQNMTRLNLWSTSWEMIKANPLFGIGPGLFGDVVGAYQVPGYYDTLAHSHNDFIYVAAISGIPALILWMSIWITWIYVVIHYVRQKEYQPDNKNLLIYISLAIGSILFAGLFQCYYTDLENTILWIFLILNGYQIMRQDCLFEKTIPA